MARRQAIDPEELFETANRLLAEGKEVTATTLLDALGGGSLRTIYKYMEIWKGKNVALPQSRTATAEIPDRVQAGFATAWKLATEEAAVAIEAAKAKAAEEVDVAGKQFQEALDACEKLEKEAEASAEKIEALHTQVSQLTDSVSNLMADKASVKATAEQLRQQVRSQESELERVHAARNEEREQFSQQVAKHEQMAAERIEAHAKELSELKAMLAEAQGKVTESEKQKDEAKAAAEDRARQLEKAEAAAKADREERERVIKEAAEQKGQLAALKEQNAALLQKLSGSDRQQHKKG